MPRGFCTDWTKSILRRPNDRDCKRRNVCFLSKSPPPYPPADHSRPAFFRKAALRHFLREATVNCALTIKFSAAPQRALTTQRDSPCPRPDCNSRNPQPGACGAGSIVRMSASVTRPRNFSVMRSSLESVGRSRNPRVFSGCNFLDVSDCASAGKILVIRARAFRELGRAARNACVGLSGGAAPEV